MFERPENIQDLIVKFIRNEITPAENDQLQQWISESGDNRQLLEELGNPTSLYQKLNDCERFMEDKDLVWEKIDKDPERQLVFLKSRRWLPYAAAAVFVLIAGYLVLSQRFSKQSTSEVTPPQIVKNDIEPGKYKAVLTLADNRTIVLDETQSGAIAKQGTVVVSKTNSGQLKYEAGAGATDHSPVTYNLLSTPKGGQYQLVLPDGSKVWLNAASSIRFPTVFTEKERKVVVTGEVYFEVKPLFTERKGSNVKVPFIVSVLPQNGGAGGTEVEVLGTHFNINAYTDEEAIKTTLLEGKVRVSTPGVFNNNKNYKLLAPGEQAQTTGNGSIVINENPDLEGVMAWKNGQFYFNKADFKTVMRQLARWYNVEVVYTGASQSQTFSGMMQRDLPLSTVLKYLERANIHVSMEGRTLRVLP